MRHLARGDVTASLFSLRSASSSPTILYLDLELLPKSIKSTVVPNITLDDAGIFFISIIWH